MTNNSSPCDDNPYQRQTYPLLIVISGPSGVGKDTILAALRRRQWPFHFVVTATTREPRRGERNGVDYFFVSLGDFAEMIDKGELLEHAVVYGQHKGIPKQQVREALACGLDVVLRIDVQGAATIKKLYPESLLVYLSAASEEEMIKRLRARRTDSDEQIKMRIVTAHEEMQRIEEFDYCVVNRDDRIEEAVDTIMAIVRAEHARTHPRKITL